MIGSLRLHNEIQNELINGELVCTVALFADRLTPDQLNSLLQKAKNGIVTVEFK